MAPSATPCRNSRDSRRSAAEHFAAAGAIVDEHYPKFDRRSSVRVDQHLAAAELR